MYNQIKPYLQGAEEIKVDKNFEFKSVRKFDHTKPAKKRNDKYADKAKSSSRGAQKRRH